MIGIAGPLPYSGCMCAQEDVEDWDKQDATNLDPQAYLREKADEATSQSASGDSEKSDSANLDDHVYHETVQQVRHCLLPAELHNAGR